MRLESKYFLKLILERYKREQIKIDKSFEETFETEFFFVEKIKWLLNYAISTIKHKNRNNKIGFNIKFEKGMNKKT